MSTMGCSSLFLGSAALAVSLIPFLSWIAIGVALPLSLAGVALSARAAAMRTAQPADRATLGLALALLLLTGLRIVLL